MGLLIDGRWHDQWYETKSSAGRFVRQDAAFRDWMTADGSTGFEAEPGRYHLYVSLACPWAHRRSSSASSSASRTSSPCRSSTRDARPGLDLQRRPRLHPGRRERRRYLQEAYTAADPQYSGSCDRPGAVGQEDRDDRQQRVVRDHPHVERGVRLRSARCGPTTTRNRCARRSTRSTTRCTSASTTACTAAGSPARRRPTKAPSMPCSRRSTGWRRGWRSRAIWSATCRPRPTGGCSPPWSASTPVYYVHFKCNLRRIADYPNLSACCASCTGCRGGRDSQHGPHQAPLLHEPQHDQPDRHRAHGSGAGSRLPRTAVRH